MKYIISLLLGVFGSSSFAADSYPPDCQAKINSLKEQGVDLDAFKQALRNIPEEKMPSRYILMAQLGEDNDGYLYVVDTYTGSVKKIPMTHGYPENKSRNSPPKREELTLFGGMKLDLTQEKTSEDYFKKYRRIETSAVSQSLKDKLKGNNGGQPLLTCSTKPKRVGANVNGPCIKLEDMEELRSDLIAEQNLRTVAMRNPYVTMFVYPSKGLKSYLKDREFANVEPDVCKALSPQPSSVRPSGASQPEGRN